MIALKALALVIFLIVPGWLAVSLLRVGEEVMDDHERLFLAAMLGTGIVAVSAFALALASAYSLTSLLITVGLISTALAIGARKKMTWPKTVGVKEIAFSLALILVALILFAPPWATVFGWTDVGVYPDIAAHIEQHGGISVENETARKVAEERIDLIYYTEQLPRLPEAYFENHFFTIQDFDSGETQPWFYFLWPSLLAVFASFLGLSEMFWAVTAMGVLALWGFYLLARRLIGERWAIAASLLFALSPLILYFTHYTSSEMMNLVLFLTGAMCLLAYVRADVPGGSRSMAVAAAFFFTLGFLCRIDFILVLIAIAACYLFKRMLIGLSSADWLFLALVTAGGAVSIAVGFVFSEAYFLTLWRSFFSPLQWLFSPVGIAPLLAVILLFIYTPRLREPALRLFRHRKTWLAILWIGLAGVFVYLYFLRPRGPETMASYGFIKAIQGPSYEKENLLRWAWYLSFIGVVLTFAGYGAWFSRRRDFGRITLAVMGFTFTMYYAWKMRALPMHILAMRRLLPVIFPLAVIMIFYALKSLIEVVSGALEGKRWYKIGQGAAIAVAIGLSFYLLLFFVNASIPIMGLEEGGNQQELCGEIAGDVGDEGTVIMGYHLGDWFGPPLRCIYGIENAWLKDDSLLSEGEFTELLDDLDFPRKPVYLLWRPWTSGEDPNLAEGLRTKLIGDYRFIEESLEKSFEHRPQEHEYMDERILLFEILPDGAS